MKTVKLEVVFDEPVPEDEVTRFRDRLYRFLMAERRQVGISFSMEEA